MSGSLSEHGGMWRDALSAFIGGPRLLEEVLGDDWLLGEEKYGILARKVKGSTSTAARGSSGYAGTSLVKVDVGGLALGEQIVCWISIKADS